MGSENSDTTFAKIQDTVLEFIHEEVERQIKIYPTILEINGERVDIDAIKFFGGEMKIVATIGYDRREVARTGENTNYPLRKSD